MKMDRDSITQYLNDLGAELERQGVREALRILVIGGAFMVTQIGNRAVTEDVDAVLMDLPDLTDKQATKSTPTLKKLKSAINAVAKQNRLPRHWFNDDSALFIRSFLARPETTFYGAFGPIHIYFPTKRCMLVLKLMVFRNKDRSDIVALLRELGITTRKQAQDLLDEFVSKEAQEYYMIPDTLDVFFE
jgi:hypothetical protein